MQQKKRFGFSRVVLLCTALLAVSGVANAQQIIWLGTLGGGTSNAYNVSSSGVVVGSAEDAGGRTRAFLWTASTGMQDLGTLGGTTSLAYAISEDGRVVVGYATDSSGQERAFLWTAQGGMQNLGTLGGTWSRALSVSPDGTFVTGSAADASGQRYPFRWTAASGMENLGSFGGESWAWGVSADGSVVVGWSRNAAGQPRAFRWTASGGLQDLGTLGGGFSLAYDVSADGNVVVGRSENPGGAPDTAFRWTPWGGMQNLGTLGGSRSFAYSVSADGNVVVGWANTASGARRACRWTLAGGAEDLNQTYAHLLTPGSELRTAYAISPDGRYIVGFGLNAVTGRGEAFLLDTMVTVTGNVELRDFGGDVTQVPVAVELRQAGNVISTLTLSLDPSGNYAFAIYPGTYDIAFKASHWLRTVVPNVSVSGSSVTVNVSLTNGDIDGDNEVTLFDFGALVAAFGSEPGDDNWNADADLDGDAEVTLFDFGVLVRNFGAIGDE